MSEDDNEACFDVKINFGSNTGYRFKTFTRKGNQNTHDEATTVDPIDASTLGTLLTKMQGNNAAGGVAGAIVGALDKAKTVVDGINQYTNPATSAAAKQIAAASQFAVSPSGASFSDLAKAATRMGADTAKTFIPLKLRGFDQAKQLLYNSGNPTAALQSVLNGQL